jgi:hypothetical protein
VDSGALACRIRLLHDPRRRPGHGGRLRGGLDCGCSRKCRNRRRFICAGAGLYSIGIPKDSALKYESSIKAGKFLLIAHGTAEEPEAARRILANTGAAGDANLEGSLVVKNDEIAGGNHMSYLLGKHEILTSRPAKFVALLALIISLSSCSKPENAATTEKAAAQKTFASPADAGAAFLEAAKSRDQGALLAIFGPDGRDVLFSGDAVKDKNAMLDFVAAYDQMHRWREMKSGGEMLYTGADNYPFPIPVGRNPSGQWYFATAAGKDEILARRIGKGELTAIAACGAIADAQQQYFSQAHDGDTVKQYAQKFVSDEGKHNGLYWPVPEGQTPSPLGQLGDFAKAAGYTNADDKPQAFNGYYFQILTKQGDKAQGGAKDYIVDAKMTGGFAILAYPAEYRNSGIMTFIIGKDGTVYQKDLGEKAADAAVAIAEYNPGGWDGVIGTEAINF